MSPFKITLSPIPQTDKDDPNKAEVSVTMTFTPEGRRPVITRTNVLRSECSADKTRKMRHSMRAALVQFYITGPGGQA